MNKADRLKIGFISRYDLNDRAAASGSFYSMASALQQYCGEVRPLAPLRISWRQARRVLKGLAVHLLRKNWDYERTTRVSRSYARQLAGMLPEEELELLFAPMGTIPVANLSTKLPVVLLSDATYAVMLNFYSGFSNFFPKHIRTGNKLEKKALDKADLILYSSEWGADSAVRDYGINPGKIRVIPFGANLEPIPTPEELRQRKKQKECRLLFLAVSWERKGGDIAVETLEELKKAGLDTRLVVCGCQPPNEINHPGLEVIPFLNKNEPSDREKLSQLMRESDFLLLPSQADATPVVIAEANAYGIPVLATKVGGIPSLIRPEENGFLFPLAARGVDYARVILDVIKDEQAYGELRSKARKAYEERLNWRSWAISFGRGLQEVLGIDPARFKHPIEVSA